MRLNHLANVQLDKDVCVCSVTVVEAEQMVWKSWAGETRLNLWFVRHHEPFWFICRLVFMFFACVFFFLMISIYRVASPSLRLQSNFIISPLRQNNILDHFNQSLVCFNYFEFKA